jgi:atypical dual specificity phosphatase
LSSTPLLSVRSFGVAFGDQTVFANVSFELARVGMASLLGPAGAGKSTLLRTLAGLNDAHPELATWGEVLFDGQPLQPSPTGEVRRGVGLVTQHAKFFLDSVRENLVSALPNRAELAPAAQTSVVAALLRKNGLGELAHRLDDDVVSLSTPLQRRLAVIRATVSDPPLLLADEPTAGLEDHDAVDVLALLRAHAQTHAVLFVTHNQRYARVAGGTTILLAGGRVQEVSPADTFFTEPVTGSGRRFVRTGGCADASPNARREDLRSSAPPPPTPTLPPARSRYEGPRGFFWLVPGRLGGLPRPGVVAPVEHDLDGLQRLGVTTLVTLEEEPTVDRELLDRRGIASIHFPIVDMGTPQLAAAHELAERLETLQRESHVVAVHCRAGLGRTGLVLACQLIFQGDCARDAIERIRRLSPKCIQSAAQVEFLSKYEQFAR